MRTKHLIIPALLSAMLASAPSFAQDRDHGGDRNGYSQDNRDQNRNNQDSRDQNRNYQDSRDQNRNYQDSRDQNRNNQESHDQNRNDWGNRHDGYGAHGGGRYGDEGSGGARWNGAGPDHDLRRGTRLPDRYRNHQYVVDDWRGHHLRRPPRGYHWVQTGGDYVLAAVASGVIADLIINH